MIYQSRHTLTKYAAAGAIALGLTLTANSSAGAHPVGGVQVTEVPSTNAFNAAWDAAKGVRGISLRSHIAGCVGESIVFPEGSEWSLCVKTVPMFGLVISHASFRKSATSGFIKVLFDGRLSSIFVPYHDGDANHRSHDISDFPNTAALPLGAGDCPSSFSKERVLLDANTICREFRDTEIAWKIDIDDRKTGTHTHRVRRGREVVYTAVLNAFNYDYIQEWAFRDDGTITPRAGSTGPRAPTLEGVGHMHNFTWRLDFDLDGPGGDSACLSRHVENLAVTPSPALDRCAGNFTVFTEAGLDWDAFQFNTLKIMDSTLTNGNFRPTNYELTPLRSGTSRHTELFTKHDFWVTRFHDGEELFAESLTFGVPPRVNPIVNGESTDGQDLVEWYTQSVHHETNARDETLGTTPTIWTGFALEPQNLFDGTPFFDLK